MPLDASEPAPGPTRHLLESALSLPEGERSWLARQLLLSLDPPPREGDDLLAEIRRRAEACRAGAMPTRPLDDVLADLDREIGEP
jgi:hypothetical protein